jgi:hypothetical protein
MSDPGQGPRKQGWAVQPELVMPDLYPPVIQVAIFDSDPADAYTRYLGEHRKIEAKHGLFSIMDRDISKYAIIKTAWNRVFREIPGDRLSILFRPADKPVGYLDRRSGRLRIDNQALACVIPSLLTREEFWLASKAVDYEGGVICWRLSLKPQPKQIIRITLDRGNSYDLEKEFDRVFE